MTKQPKWLKAKNIQAVFTLLAQNGGEGRIVGGAVRDHLMNVAIGDIDFCSTHTPQQVIEVAKKNNIKYIETGVKYGTVTLILDGQPFEVTALREDVATDGRHAEVIYGTDFKRDAMRRDFTFNALYMDADGKILDPLGTGITDLKDHKIKFIGNAAARIKEDYLRILRYFRFIARLGFDYDATDYAQIAPLVAGLDQLSAERLLAEFKRIYQSAHLLHGLKLMAECKIFKQIFNVQVNLGQLDYLQNNKLNVDYIWLVQFKLSLPNADGKKLKLSNKDQKTLGQLNNFPDVLNSDDAHLGQNTYRHGKAVMCQNLTYFAAETNLDFTALKQKLDFVESFKIPTFPINGQDLFELGFKAGPEMGKKIKQLETEWLSSNFTMTKQQLLTAI